MIHKTLRYLKTAHQLRKLFLDLDLSGHSVVELGTYHELMHEAKRLHASVYLERKFVSPEHVTEEGHLSKTADPHQTHSYYFAVVSKGSAKIIAVSRQIEHTGDKYLRSFPILEKAEIYERYKTYIAKCPADMIVEISGLAKQRGTSQVAPLLLYRAMWQRSLRLNHGLWLMACDVRLYERLKLMFGPAIVQIGKVTTYQGGDVIPALVRPAQALTELKHFTHQKAYLNKKMRKGIYTFFSEGLTTMDKRASGGAK
jgi:hypothetical protein